MNIKYIVLCSKGNSAREANVELMKLEIPELRVINCTLDNVFPAHIAALNVADEYDGVLMLEDDVQLCRNFKQRVDALIASHLREVVSMFEGACSKNEMHSEYRNGREFAWNQCNYWPREVGKILSDPKWMIPFIEWFDKRNEPWGYPIDVYQAYVLGKCKIKYWMEVPFLVQHLDMRSNFKGRSTKRQTKYFADDLEQIQ